MRKVLTALIVAVMAATVVAGCSGSDKNAETGRRTGQSTVAVNPSGFPIVSEPITLSIFNRQSPTNAPWDKMLVFQEYEQMTNIKTKFENVPTEGFEEKRNLVLGTNKLPDVFISANLTRTDAVKYGASGMLIPLEGLIDQYAPNIKRLFDQYPEVRQALTGADGHIYALSDFVTLTSARTHKHWINEKWLKQLGLEEPQTLDELTAVLRAFKEGDPNGNKQQDEIPMTALGIDNILANLRGSFGLEGQLGDQINIEDGKVRMWIVDDRYKEMLQYLRQLYAEGLLDNGIFSHTAQDYIGKISTGRAGFFYEQATDLFSKVAGDYAGIAPPAGPHGDRMHTQALPIARSYGVFAITSRNPSPEATIRWIDYFAGDEGSIFLRYGVEGKTFHYGEDGKPVYNDDILKDDRGMATAISQFAPWPGTGITHWINDRNASAVNPPQVQAAAQKLEPYIPTVYAAPIFDADTSKRVDQLRADIVAYADESKAKFINGETDFGEWDKYVSTLRKMGLEELEGIYQQYYDSVYKK